MLYYLFRFLEQFDIPGARLWGYISFRAVLAFVFALVISIYFGERFIKYMRRHNHYEEQRDYATDPFNVNKVGVPTMGGIIIIMATILPSLFFGRLRNIYMIMMIVTTLWLGFLGFMDDYLKMTRSKDGMKPIVKLLGQAILGLGIGLTLYISPDAVIRENITVMRQPVAQSYEEHIPSFSQQQPVQTTILKSKPIKSTKTTLPFFKNHNVDYKGWFGFMGPYQQAAGWVFFVFMTIFIIMAVSNGSNLNDGMDGMCAGNSAIICVALGVLAYFSSNLAYASYFDIMYIPDAQELVIFISAFVGALTGFLWYNSYPAQIFMGDTGSLAIGGIIAVLAIIIHKELLIPVLCIIFLLESVSVILQTNYAKYGNKKGLKLRVFKRAPFHDTFRMRLDQLPADFKVLIRWPRGAWHESKITNRFWIVTMIAAALAIITLKVR